MNDLYVRRVPGSLSYDLAPPQPAPPPTLPSASCMGPRRILRSSPREYTELQPLLSGVHSVMRVKLALAGEGGGARPPPFITFTITSKVAVYAPAEWIDTITLFHLLENIYSVVGTSE